MEGEPGTRHHFFCSRVERGRKDLQLAWAEHHVLTESLAGQLMNASVIQSIGRQMKAKVLGLRLVDATSSPKMLLRKSLLQQGTPFSSNFRVISNRLATTRVPRGLSNAARETPLLSLKQGSKDTKDVPGKHWAKACAACG